MKSTPWEFSKLKSSLKSSLIGGYPGIPQLLQRLDPLIRGSLKVFLPIKKLSFFWRHYLADTLHKFILPLPLR
jgi:hypothetical protein